MIPNYSGSTIWRENQFKQDINLLIIMFYETRGLNRRIPFINPGVGFTFFYYYAEQSSHFWLLKPWVIIISLQQFAVGLKPLLLRALLSISDNCFFFVLSSFSSTPTVIGSSANMARLLQLQCDPFKIAITCVVFVIKKFESVL